MNGMTKKHLWIIAIVFAITIGLYPIIYLFIDRKFGLLNTKTEAILTSVVWNIAFYCHIFFGAIALLIGWINFGKAYRAKHLSLHKRIGKVYVMSVLISALGSIYIGVFATGGIITSIGFISLGILWFYTTLMALIHVKNKRITLHQKLMIYSYALSFAAVTLRLWMPLMIFICQDFDAGYKIASWLCWIPNVIVAYYINKHYFKSYIS